MRTPSRSFSNSPRQEDESRRAADNPVAPHRSKPHEAVVAGTFKSLGFAVGGVVERARQQAQLALNGKTNTQERPVAAELCKNCDAIVDTAADPDCHVEIGNMRKLTSIEIHCASCRDKLLEQKEIADAASCLGEEQAERQEQR